MTKKAPETDLLSSSHRCTGNGRWGGRSQAAERRCGQGLGLQGPTDLGFEDPSWGTQSGAWILSFEICWAKQQGCVNVKGPSPGRESYSLIHILHFYSSPGSDMLIRR